MSFGSVDQEKFAILLSLMARAMYILTPNVKPESLDMLGRSKNGYTENMALKLRI